MCRLGVAGAPNPGGGGGAGWLWSQESGRPVGRGGEGTVGQVFGCVALAGHVASHARFFPTSWWPLWSLTFGEAEQPGPGLGGQCCPCQGPRLPTRCTAAALSPGPFASDPAGCELS